MYTNFTLSRDIYIYISRDRLKLVFFCYLSPFYPLKTLKNQNSYKMKQIAGNAMKLRFMHLLTYHY